MNLKDEYETVIIGAGPAGLAAAMELCKARKDFVVIEKNCSVGGLARTHVIKEGHLEFRTDIGPHRFYSRKGYLNQFIGDLLQEKLIVVKRETQQYIDGKFFNYPINPVQAFKNLGFSTVIIILVDYFLAILKYRIFRRPIKNFYEHAVANFGKKLAMFNIINYTEKIWGLSTKQLDASWGKRRITGLSLSGVIKNMLVKISKRQNSIRALVDTFYYPELGTGTIYEQIGERIELEGYSIFLNSYPTKIKHERDHIKQLVVQIGEKEIQIKLDYLVESIYIVDFLLLLEPSPPQHVLKAAEKLRYRSQVYLFLTLDRDRVTHDQWIYFPDVHLPFARISEMKNFSSKMSPLNKSSLLIEFFCNEDDEIHRMTKDELFELVLPFFEKQGFFTRIDVRNCYRFSNNRDYPIYDLVYETNLNTVKRYLDSFDNLFYVGRPGRFEYSSQDQSIEMGILSGKSIIDGHRRDLDAVMNERE